MSRGLVTKENMCAFLIFGSDLMFYNKVEKGGKHFYIPQVQFYKRPRKTELEKIKDTLHEIIADLRKSISKNDIVFFDDGIVKQAYILCFLNCREWKAFLAKAGLAFIPHNQRKQPTIDARWIHQSLINGASSLRWGRKSNDNLWLPQKIL